MSSDYEKTLHLYVQIAESAGWTVTRTSNGHWRFVPADPAAAIVHAAGTSSADRATANLRSGLRRSGLDL